MNAEVERQKQRYLNNRFSNEIIKLFVAGISEKDQDFINNKISCIEAVEVRRYTIGRIQELPLDFKAQQS